MTEKEFRLLEREELIALYNEHMKVDFPPDELKPLSWLLNMLETGLYEPYGLFQDGKLTAYALYWKTEQDAYVMLDYFAVVRDQRNRGVGSSLLRDMLDRFCTQEGRGVFGEVEAPISGDEEIDALRRRRLGFYDRAGFRQMGFRTKIFGVSYIVIAYGPSVTDEELIEVDRKLYRSTVPAEKYQQEVFIPEEI